MAGEFIRESLPKDLPSLPAGWEYVPLANLVEDSRGICYGIVQPGSASDLGVPILRVNNVRYGRITIEDALRVSPDIEARYVRSRLRGGEIVLTLVGSLGESAIVPPELAGWNVARAVGVIPVADRTDTRWVEFCLRTPLLQHYIRIWATTTVQATFNLRDVAKLPIPMPPPAEKRAIACILGALDDKIELNRRMNRTLEAMARAIFQSWFVDFDPVRAKFALSGAEGAAGKALVGLQPEIAALFPDRLVEVEGREIPEGWELTTLGDVTAKHGGLIQTGPFGSQLHASDYVEAGIPTIMPKDISDRRVRTEKIAYIDEADAARLGRHRVLPGDIVYSRRGDVERHALIGKREQGWLCGTGCMLVRPGAKWPSPLFMSLHLDRPDIKEWITQHAIGATMPNLNTSVLGQVSILAPSHTILKAFEVLAGPLDEKSAGNERQSRTLAALRDTLLPQLISGALRVADAERIVGRCL